VRLEEADDAARQTVEAVGRGDLQQGVDQPARPAHLLHRRGVGHRPLAHLPHLRVRLGQTRSRPADEEALAVGDVEVGEHR